MHDIWLIVVCALVTMLTRFLPFLIFRKKTPAIVTYLGKVLPCAIMGMLVVYCMKDVNFLGGSHGIPEALGCIITAGLHVWKRSPLLSIGVGTVSYMLLVQLVF